MSELKIVMKQDETTQNVELFINGRTIPAVKNFKLEFVDGQAKFEGIRCISDRAGQFVTKDGETVTEPINLLGYLDPYFENLELVKQYQKAIDWDLKNIYMTSMVNAENYIKERGFNS